MKSLNLFTLTIIFSVVTGCSKNELSKDAVQGKRADASIDIAEVSAFSSPTGDVVGKLTTGYQGWFASAGDGSPFNSWQHPNLETWPNCAEYTTTYTGIPFSQAGVVQPGFTGNLGNGLQAKMFTSYDQQVSNKHAEWMQQNGFDCIALQRFGSAIISGTPKKAFFDGILTRMKNAAQTYGRKFYVMYDCSSFDPIDADWTNTIVGSLNLTSSTAYAKQNGKLVVCLWGVGKSGRGTTAEWVTKINWFKSQGCYVIGGLQGNFTTDTANFSAFQACDMIMPWYVGRTGNFQTAYTGDLNWANANSKDFQAMVYPGFAFNNSNTAKPKNEIKRMHGDFMWSQFAAIRNLNIKSAYAAMFDEAQEGTAIFKSAENVYQIPTGKYFLTLDADGVIVSSDFYLRLVNDGQKMMKGITGYSSTHPTVHVNGVTFYQNTNYGGVSSHILPIGNYNMAQLKARGMANDWASSVRVPNGRTVILYSNDNFTGTSWTRTSDTPSFLTLSPSANDLVSSIKVQ